MLEDRHMGLMEQSEVDARQDEWIKDEDCLADGRNGCDDGAVFLLVVRCELGI